MGTLLVIYEKTFTMDSKNRKEKITNTIANDKNVTIMVEVKIYSI